MKTERLFISLNIDENNRLIIAEIQQKLREIFKVCLIKWENAGKFHLTLRFLGDVKQEETENLIRDLSGYTFGFDEISIKSTEIGFFPNAKRPRIIYLGFEEQGNNLEPMVDFIDGRLKRYGIYADKPFVPHLTLGRFRKENKKPAYGIDIEKFSEVCIKFNSFHLMESKLDFKGSKFFVKKEFNFKK